jgi:hypothetical protein
LKPSVPGVFSVHFPSREALLDALTDAQRSHFMA